MLARAGRIEHRAPIRRPGGPTIYAIVRTGGKQYRVEPDQLIDVDSLPAEVGSTVELSDVLLIGGNGDVHVGQPLVEGARVIAEVVEQGRDRKIIVFKYKAKTRYRRRRGHRQGYTRLAVRQILTAEAEKPKPHRAAKATVGDVTPEAEEKLVRRTRARKPAAAPEQAASTATQPEGAAAEAPVVAEKPKRTRAPKTEAAAEGGTKLARRPRPGGRPSGRAGKPQAEATDEPKSESSEPESE
ncbi:MAG: 50S ribosomal protein L21 [Dehalococcoidia bacterium]